MRILASQPPPEPFASSTVPPACTAMWRTTGSPIPVWSGPVRVVNPASKTFSSNPAGIPGPWSLTVNSHPSLSMDTRIDSSPPPLRHGLRGVEQEGEQRQPEIPPVGVKDPRRDFRGRQHDHVVAAEIVPGEQQDLRNQLPRDERFRGGSMGAHTIRELLHDRTDILPRGQQLPV